MKATGFQGIVLVLAAPPLPVHRVSNYSDADDAIMIERREAMITDKVGVDGKMAVFLSANKSGKITIKVFQTSPTNKYLNQVCQLAEWWAGHVRADRGELRRHLPQRSDGRSVRVRREAGAGGAREGREGADLGDHGRESPGAVRRSLVRRVRDGCGGRAAKPWG